VVVFDANMLIALVSPKTSKDDRARLEYLVKTLSDSGTYVGVPTPAYAEFFVDAAQATSPVLHALKKKEALRVLPLDERCAIEAALLTRNALASPGGKRGASRKVWQHIKVDLQIVAIAKANNAAAIYSDDSDLRTQAKTYGLNAFALAELPLPPESRQPDLPFVKGE
jgi:predicted nucleic acid-binding protein